MFELKSLSLEPGARVSDRFVRDIAAAVQRCADWHGCPQVRVTAGTPAAFVALLETALASERASATAAAPVAATVAASARAAAGKRAA